MKADLVKGREAVDLGKWHARVVGCEFQRRDHQLERIESVIGVLGAVVELAEPDDDGNALGIGHQRALHSGFRFSANASGPARASSLRINTDLSRVLCSQNGASAAMRPCSKIGRADVWTQVTNEHLGGGRAIEKK